MGKRGIPLAAMERIMLEAGADRVSESAKKELQTICVELATKYGERASKYAEHAGRKTVKAEDIKLAVKQNN